MVHTLRRWYYPWRFNLLIWSGNYSAHSFDSVFLVINSIHRTFKNKNECSNIKCVHPIGTGRPNMKACCAGTRLACTLWAFWSVARLDCLDFVIFTHKAHFDILNILPWILNEMADWILYFGCGCGWLYSPSLSPAEQAVLPSKQPCAQLSQARNVTKSIWRTS